jgi:3-methylfumaryl-CoA hydratase
MSAGSRSLEGLRDFVGRSASSVEVASLTPVLKLAATLGITPPAKAAGDPLPPGWHTVYFPPLYGPDAMRPDGQSTGSAWSPKVPLERHRLGLDRAEFHAPVRIGEELKRVATTKDVRIEERAEGPLVTVLVRHEISGPGGLAVVEERESIYYDSAPPALSPLKDLPEARWRRVIEPTPVLLFRFSAVRFNSHRVHYDRDYAVNVEGLPGLIVHATLLSTLLLELLRESFPGRPVLAFAPRTRHPVCDTGKFTLCLAPAGSDAATLWVIDAQGSVAMHGAAALGA